MGFFDYILSLSVKGSVLIAVVTAIRFFIKRYPKKYSYALWCVVFFSLAVQITLPAYFENPFNMPQQSVTETYESITESYSGQVEFHHAGTAKYAQAVSQGVVPVQTQTENYVITAKDTLEQPKTIGEIVLPKLHILWMIGVAVLLVVYLKNVVDIISLLKFSVCCKNNIYYNEYIKTPFTFGLLKPKIYLPSDMDKSQERYVLSHEYAHISRLDHIIKPLCLMITILHWFNPLVWLAFGLMTKDMELSCDEKVIKSYEGQEKKDYCTALLNFALKDKPYKMSAVLFGESNCGQRIKNVLNFKQPKKIMAAVMAVIIAVVAFSTVATMKKPEKENAFTGMSIEELDKAVPNSDQDRLMIWQAMDAVEDAEIEKYLAEKIEKYCRAGSFAVFRDISVHQDHLTLVYSENRKPLQNGTVHITLQLLPYDNADIKTEAEKYMADMFSWLADESEFFNFKVEAAGYTVENESGGKIAHSDADVSDSFENPAIWLNWSSKGPKIWYAAQSETELNAQKTAFRAVKGNKNFMLKKFGITGGDTLRMEYHVEDDYFLAGAADTAEKLAKQTADLNNIYANISEKVLLDEDVRKYIEINGIHNAVIAFSHRFLENGVVEFPLVVSKAEFVPDYDVNSYDGLPAVTEDGIPIDEIKTYPGHIAVVPQEKEIYYTAVDKSYFNDAVFIGDSIAEGLRVYTNIDNSLAEIADFVTMTNYSPYEFMQAKLWTSSQTATGLEHTINFRPNKVYILMGTDALTFMDEKDFLAGYLDMVKALREALPDKDIYICSIPPVRADFAASKPIFKSLGYINSHLENFAKDNGAYYLNLHEILADDSKYGWLKEEYVAVDGVHPNTQCYSDIIEYFRTHIVVKPGGLAVRDYDKFLEALNSSDKKEKFAWPTEKNVFISRGFVGEYPAHNGVDIAGPQGTEIYAAWDGTVTKSENSTVGDGNHIIIDHGDGLRTLYAHCEKLLVKEGEKVTRGQLIATMGCTGNSTGNHLHFGVSRDYVYEDPYEMLGGYLSTCDECGAQVMVWTGDYTQWQPVQMVDCIHGLDRMVGYDIVCNRLFSSIYSCEKCGYAVSQTLQQSKNQCVNTQQTTPNYHKEGESFAAAFGWPTEGGVSITRGFSDGIGYKLIPQITDGKIHAVSDGLVFNAAGDSFAVSAAEYSESYANCGRILVNNGDYVREGDVVATLADGANAEDYRVWHYPAKHSGVDIAGSADTAILAAADGTVAECGNDEEYGSYIVLQHSNGYKTKYAHCSKLIAKMGERVKRGQHIADMGTTGLSTGVHLHFEITDKNGVAVDPYRYW